MVSFFDAPPQSSQAVDFAPDRFHRPGGSDAVRQEGGVPHAVEFHLFRAGEQNSRRVHGGDITRFHFINQ